MDKHAVYAMTAARIGGQVVQIPFRIGQPTDWHTAQARWRRLADRAQGCGGVTRRPLKVRHDGRKLAVMPYSIEVRATDATGRGLGSERHTVAFPVPYRALKSAIHA